MNNVKFLTDEDLRQRAPSVFAVEPWRERSEKYCFIPTIEVVDALRDAGYFPVMAAQSRCVLPGKREFAKHMLRFRQREGQEMQVNDILPEVVLINSHDGTSAYNMMLGFFRLVCSNGLVVADSTIENIHVRHIGRSDLCQQVIDASRQIMQQAPQTVETVNRWCTIELSTPEQTAFAESALKVYDSAIELRPDSILYPRRWEDRGNGTRSLWKTFNTVQENLTKGHIRGRSTNGRRMSTRAISSVDRDVKLNKALWTLAQKMEELKAPVQGLQG